MAYTNGTAANYKDLLAAMVTFATANGWVALEQSATAVFLKGTGLAGLDEIYVGIETYENPTSNVYNWNLFGSWGYRTGRTYNKMPHNSHQLVEDVVAGCFWNTTMDYWMVANPRRVIVCAKVGTTYQMVHFGHLTVPATEAQYPYPLFIGGASNINTENYSSNLGHFWGNNGTAGGGRLHTPGGAWCVVGTQGSLSTDTVPIYMADHVCNTFDEVVLSGLDDTYLLSPVYLVGKTLATYGHIEGLFRVTGYDNTAENVVTVDSDNYIVFPDGSRSGFGDFCAMRMN